MYVYVYIYIYIYIYITAIVYIHIYMYINNWILSFINLKDGEFTLYLEQIHLQMQNVQS